MTAPAPSEFDTAMQTVTEYIGRWEACSISLSASVAQNVSLQQQLAQAVAERQTFYSELLAAREEINRLNKLLHPVPHITFCLSNPDPKIGDLMERTYSKAGIGKAPTKPVVHSFKQYVQADVTAWVKAAPAGSTIIFFHEPEDNIEGKSLTIPVLQEQTISLCQTIIDAGRVGEIRPATCFMQFSLDAGPTRGPARLKMVTDIMSPALVAKLKEAQGICGWDCYAGPGADDGPDRTPEQLFGKCATFATNLGLPWGVYESGASSTATSPDDKHAAWWQRVFDYFGSGKIAPPLHMTNWNAPAPGVGRTYSVAGLPKTLAVWKAAILKYSG